MPLGKEYRFAACEALTPAGKPVTIPPGTFSVAESDVVSIVINGRILDITPASFQLLKLDCKATQL